MKKSVASISDFVTQVYVIHRTGMVILSRKYADGCISSDPQLIGGLVAAIMTVTQATSDVVTSCDGSDDGQHRLTEFKTTCSKWFINQEDDLVVAMLIPNRSPFTKETQLVQSMSKQILQTYVLYQQFTIDTDEKVEDDKNDELGNTVDEFVSDIIKQLSGEKLDFSKEGTIDHYDLSVDSI